MWSVQVINPQRKILGLSWSGLVQPHEVAEANASLEAHIRRLPTPGFDLLVDMLELLAWPPETQKEIVVHQRWLLQRGMRRAAVVTSSMLTRMQLNRTARESDHRTEKQFDTVGDALFFLETTEPG